MINKLKTLGYAGVLAGAVLGSYSLGRMQGAKDYEAVPVVQGNPLESEVAETPKSLDNHTLAVLRLKNALGDRLEDEAGLYKMDEETLYILSEIDRNPDWVSWGYHMDEGDSYDNFNPEKLSLKELTTLEKNCPWDLIPSNGRYTDKERLEIYTWLRFEFHNQPICPVW